MPQTGVDAILVGSELVISLQTIVARKLPPASGAVVSVTQFTTDGRRNILPGRATLKGDVRTRKLDDCKVISELMLQIADGVAAAHGVKISLEFHTEFEPTVNSAEQTIAAVKAARAIGCDVIPDRDPVSFSEDFGRITAAIPGCFILMGNGTVGPYAQPLHASNYDFNDSALPIGAAFWAHLATQRLPRKGA